MQPEIPMRDKLNCIIVAVMSPNITFSIDCNYHRLDDRQILKAISNPKMLKTSIT